MIRKEKRFVDTWLGVGVSKHRVFWTIYKQNFLRNVQHFPTCSKLHLKWREPFFLTFATPCLQWRYLTQTTSCFWKGQPIMACLNVNSANDTKLLSGKNVARALGVHRRNIISANSRLQIEEDNGNLCLSACQRQAHRTSNITPEIKDLVFEFWATETCVSPNKKDICQKRIGKNAFVVHPVHLLDQPQVCNYLWTVTQAAYDLWLHTCFSIGVALSTEAQVLACNFSRTPNLFQEF